jgi:hypothetical protein
VLERNKATILVVLLGAIALIAAGSAFGARPATRSERAQLVSAVRHHHNGIAHPNRVHVPKILISTKGPWAKLRLVLRLPGGKKDIAFAVAHKTNGRWKIVSVGSAGLGCGLPTRVARDLHLYCP